MEYTKKSNDFLKSSDLSKEDTRITFSKSYKTNSLRNLASVSLRESKQSPTFEILFQDILKRMQFFERPDIIPYPFNDLNGDNKPSKLTNRTSEKNLKKRKNSKGNNSNRAKRDKNLGNKGKTSRSGSKNKGFDCDFHSHQGIQCDTCVRLHGHKWARIDD